MLLTVKLHAHAAPFLEELRLMSKTAGDDSDGSSGGVERNLLDLTETGSTHWLRPDDEELK